MVFDDLVTEKHADSTVFSFNGDEMCFHVSSCETIAATPSRIVLDTSLVGRGVSRHTYPGGVQRHNAVSSLVVCQVSMSRNTSKFSSSMRVAIVADLFPTDCAFDKSNVIGVLLLVVDTGEVAFVADDLADVNIRCHLILARSRETHGCLTGWPRRRNVIHINARLPYWLASTEQRYAYSCQAALLVGLDGSTLCIFM